MWELGSTETRNVVYNCVKCMMEIGYQFRQANTKKLVAAVCLSTTLVKSTMGLSSNSFSGSYFL